LFREKKATDGLSSFAQGRELLSKTGGEKGRRGKDACLKGGEEERNT